MNQYPNTTAFFSAKTTTGASDKVSNVPSKKTVHAVGNTSASTGAAVIDIEVSNKPTPSVDADWLVIATISLTLGTTQTGDGFASDAAWRHIRANVKSISGTGANVTCWLGA